MTDTTTETAWADPEAAARRYYLEAQTALQDDAPWEALAPSFRAGLTNEAAAWARALAPQIAELQRAAKVEALREAAMVVGSEQKTYTWLMTRADAIERGEG